MGMDLPELWQLRYFKAVAEHLHFGRAAQALHISQPPLSRAVRALEGRLGVALFVRTRRRVELTPEGARLLEHARGALEQLERAVADLRGMASGERGRLRIGFVHARERRPALPALLTVAGLSIFGVAHMTLLPVYAERVFGSRDVFAWIVVASGIGAMTGALVAGYAHRTSLRTCAVQLMCYGLALAGFAFATNLWLALAAIFTIFCAVGSDVDTAAIADSIGQMAADVARYVPGYRLLQDPQFDPPSAATGGATRVAIFVEVAGMGEFLPPYAGNLDIMTAAATRVGEELARRMQ